MLNKHMYRYTCTDLLSTQGCPLLCEKTSHDDGPSLLDHYNSAGCQHKRLSCELYGVDNVHYSANTSIANLIMCICIYI